MNYKLKTEPEVVYYMETKQCTVEDENGVEHEIRISEHSKGTDMIILNGNNWDDITDGEFITWILENLTYEEVQK